MANELKAEFGVDAVVTAGSHGIFDVIVDGKTVFSKDETMRFPEPGEVTKLMNG